MSSKGQIVLPKAVREAHALQPGAEFELTDDGEKIILTPVRPVVAKRLSIDQFLSRRIAYRGPAITDESIDRAIQAEAKKRWDEENSH